MFFDEYATLWGLAMQGNSLVACSESRDVVLAEGLTKDQAVSLALDMRREKDITEWVRIPIE